MWTVRVESHWGSGFEKEKRGKAMTCVGMNFRDLTLR